MNAASQASTPPLLSVKDLRVHFPIKGDGDWPWTPMRALKAVDGVSFELQMLTRFAGRAFGNAEPGMCFFEFFQLAQIEIPIR